MPFEFNGFRIFSKRSPVAEWVDDGAMHWAPGFEKIWLERIKDIESSFSARPAGDTFSGYYTIKESEFARLGAKYGADYIVTASTAALHFDKLYDNGGFAVYRMPGANEKR